MMFLLLTMPEVNIFIDGFPQFHMKVCLFFPYCYSGNSVFVQCNLKTFCEIFAYLIHSCECSLLLAFSSIVERLMERSLS